MTMAEGVGRAQQLQRQAVVLEQEVGQPLHAHVLVAEQVHQLVHAARHRGKVLGAAHPLDRQIEGRGRGGGFGVGDLIGGRQGLGHTSGPSG
jgi:hypothetical protein